MAGIARSAGETGGVGVWGLLPLPLLKIFEKSDFRGQTTICPANCAVPDGHFLDECEVVVIEIEVLAKLNL